MNATVAVEELALEFCASMGRAHTRVRGERRRRGFPLGVAHGWDKFHGLGSQ